MTKGKTKLEGTIEEVRELTKEIRYFQEEVEETGRAIDRLVERRIILQIGDLDLGEIRKEISQTATIASSMQSAIQGISFGGIKTQLKEISQLTSTLFDGFEHLNIMKCEIYE